VKEHAAEVGVVGFAFCTLWKMGTRGRDDVFRFYTLSTKLLVYLVSVEDVWEQRQLVVFSKN
jgi:hypothetical protein